ncbi:MAG: hypothetical protein R2794_01825 [Chitinophagales bacterium]
MKNVAVLIFVCILFGSCGGSSSEKKAEIDPALALLEKNNCKTCHKPAEKFIGPSFHDIAARYAGYPDTIVQHLAQKVISGGTGVWDSVPMAPHPDLLPSEAETLVRYVLRQ